MIILDTNILSSLMQTKPNKKIVSWLDSLDEGLIWITSITVYEIQYGIELLSSGRKKVELLTAFENMLRNEYNTKIMEFDVNAALAAGELAANHKKTGRNIDVRDLQITGIALAHGAYIATRNEKDFRDSGVEIINPFIT